MLSIAGRRVQCAADHRQPRKIAMTDTHDQARHRPRPPRAAPPPADRAAGRAHHAEHGARHARRRSRRLRQRRLRRPREGVLPAARATTRRRCRSPVRTASPKGVERSPGRDYTPRRYDVGRNELVIDFALHDAGPATTGPRRPRPASSSASAGRAARSSCRTISTGICSSATRPRCRRSAGGWRSCAPARAPSSSPP